MSTEVASAVAPPAEVEVYKPIPKELIASPALVGFAEDLTLAYQIASKLVTTSFVPASYNGRADEAAVAILTGQRFGFDPLASLSSIDIINGTPAFRALTLRAIVQSKGHEIWTVESTKTRAVVKAKRKGSDKTETSTWDLDRANDLGLLNKDNWKKQSPAMLLARATSEVVRLVAADALLGIAYSIEELTDGVIVEAGTEEVKSGPRTVQRASAKRQRPAAKTAPKTEPEQQSEAPEAEIISEPWDEEPEAPAKAPAEKKPEVVNPDNPLAPQSEAEAKEWGLLPPDGEAVS